MTDTHIKIKPVTPRVQYTANGSTTVFPYSFAIFDDSDMVVYVDDDVITTGYTVSGAGQTDGGNVTFATAPDDGKKITLLRNVPIERMTDFQEGGTFRPKNLNDEFDRQTAFAQQVQEKVERTLILPPTTEIDPSQVLEQVERIYNSIDNVDAVADDITNVNSVAGNLTNINAVDGNKTNIDSVAGNASNINAVASNASDISNVSTNMSDINNCVSNMSYILDAPNQAQAAANSAAMAYQYGNDKINQTHISNCVTYIPQDIKIELNNGTLTLKSGSKVYVPNGAGVFDVVTTTSDMNIVVGGNDRTMVFINADGSGYQYRYVSYCNSGNSDPQTVGTTYYDRTTNKILCHNSADSHPQVSFPIAIITMDNNDITGIDNVFNGFGYIGASVFVLPGVKGLVPNGRNSDGTLKNEELTVTNVLETARDSSGWNGRWSLYVTATTRLAHPTRLEYISNTKPSGIYTTTAYWYSPSDNKLYYTQDTGDTWEQVFELRCLDFVESSTRVISFMPKFVFRALDYYDLSAFARVVETYSNGTSWYRIYSDGWCEQGGYVTGGVSWGATTVNLLKTMSDTNYFVTKNWVCSSSIVGASYDATASVYGKANMTTSSFPTINGAWDGFYWKVCGYIK